MLVCRGYILLGIMNTTSQVVHRCKNPLRLVRSPSSTEPGISFGHLPPNMTDVLQVMDLVVNGPVKAGIRRARVEALFQFFQNWKFERLQHISSKSEGLPPAFKPPKPTQAAGMMTTLKVLNSTLTADRGIQAVAA